MAESFRSSQRALRLSAAGDLAVDTGDIDIAWELDGHLLVMDFVEEAASPERARAMMPTLNEEDPLRYDLAYRREHAARAQGGKPAGRSRLQRSDFSWWRRTGIRRGPNGLPNFWKRPAMRAPQCLQAPSSVIP